VSCVHLSLVFYASVCVFRAFITCLPATATATAASTRLFRTSCASHTRPSCVLPPCISGPLPTVFLGHCPLLFWVAVLCVSGPQPTVILGQCLLYFWAMPTVFLGRCPLEFWAPAPCFSEPLALVIPGLCPLYFWATTPCKSGPLPHVFLGHGPL
jgi:hypothetical protein